MILPISEIKTIGYNDDYSEAMAFVVENSGKIELQVPYELDYILDEDWQFKTLRQLQGKTDFITSVEIDNNEYFSGFIKEVEEDYLTIQMIGSLGEEEGLELYNICDIRGIKINDLDNRKRLLLYNWRKTK